MTSKEALHSFWFNRFRVCRVLGNQLSFRDALIPGERRVPVATFEHHAGAALHRLLFQYGFVPAAIGSAGPAVRANATDASDKLFWQYPCRTEGAAWDEHAQQSLPVLQGDTLHVYLGLPWATWIDVDRKNAWGTAGRASMQLQLQMTGVRLAGLRSALAELGVVLKVHTVCQHIYWRDMSTPWRQLGVTDAWLSHCPGALADESPGFAVHPWSLYAVNVRDGQRRAGIIEGKDPAEKSLLASFIGAHAPHYLSDVRLRLRDFASTPRFEIRVTDRWHFEEIVYGHQIANAPIKPAAAETASIERYNAVLSDSIFSLCPAGAGPNTLRLWESLAVGAVPVLLGPVAAMPRGGNLPDIDWERIVVRVEDDQLADLPRRLNAISLDKVRTMQRLGMAAYAQVRKQRCF